MHIEHRGLLYGLFAALANAVMAVFIKYAADIPNETLVFFRFAIGLISLAPLIYHKKPSFSWKNLTLNLPRSIAGLGSIYCAFYALKELPLVNAVTLTNTAPLLMPFVVLVWLRLLVSRVRFLAAFIGFIGVVILTHPTKEIFQWASLAGAASGLLGAIALVSVRQVSKIETTEAILAYYFAICAVLSFPPMIVSWEPVSLLQWGYLVLIGVFSMGYQYLLTKSYTHAPATRVSTMNYVAVIFSGLAGWWIFGEVPAIGALLGASLILISALLVLFDSGTTRPLKDD